MLEKNKSEYLCAFNSTFDWLNIIYQPSRSNYSHFGSFQPTLELEKDKKDAIIRYQANLMCGLEYPYARTPQYISKKMILEIHFRNPTIIFSLYL